MSDNAVTHEVIPYVGVGTLCFGMTEDEATGSVGSPVRSTRTASGEHRLIYPEFHLTFSESRLAEVSFHPEAHLIVAGIDLFRDAEPLQHLARLDPLPLESVGILYFPNLGITLSGFHNEGARTVTVMRPGRLDGLLSKFRPYSVEAN